MIFGPKEKKYFVSWFDTEKPAIGCFMATSSLKGEALIRRMIDIAKMHSPNASVLSINIIP
jgi:hypothetical protein